MLLTPLICRWLICAGLACATSHAVQAQSPSATDSPTLTDDFIFTLNQGRDDAIHRAIEKMREQEEMQRSLDLRAADVSVVTRVIDLFRFVPLKLESSDSKADYSFTPNYLRPDYNRATSDGDLFDRP